ncbi:MAG: LysR family transcriptional regulator [Betaproteobacteria bacterium]|nr:LysR family transcriptional regulator [Betaproteobacteria bacterium]
MLNPDLLLVFISVAENSSFTRAANELNRSQSAISMQVKRLEEMLGVPVFERSGKNVKLSPEGKVLLGYARRILRLMNEAIAAVGKKTEGKTVRLGCIEDYAARILPRVLVNFWTTHPDVHIEVDTGETSDLLKKLGDDYDMVLAMHMMPQSAGIFLRMDRLVWATSPVHSPHEADPLPMALRPAGCQESEWATAALDSALRPWRCAFVSAAIGTLQGAVEEGLAVGMFKESTLTGSLRILTPLEGFADLPSVGICLHIAPDSLLRPDVNMLSAALIKSLQPNEPV